MSEMLKNLRSNKPVLLGLSVVAFMGFFFTGYMVYQSFSNRILEYINPTSNMSNIAETVTAQAATVTAQAATATALAATATALAATTTAQDATPTALAATPTALAATATAQTATPTAMTTTETVIPKEVSPSPTAMSADEFSPTIKNIFERGYLIAGVKCDFFPMGFIQNQLGNTVDCDFERDYESDERSGFEVDIMKEFAKRWLGDESAVKFKTVKNPEDNMIKLEEYLVDLVIAAMTHTKKRDERIGFSQTYFLDGQSLLVTDPEQINSVEDLDGRRVAVLTNTTSLDNINTEAERLGVTIEVIPVETHDEGLKKLLLNINNENKVDAYTTDSVRLLQLSQQDRRLRLVGGRFSKEPYGIGVPKGDAEFRDLVNFTLQEMKLDNTYDRIYGKWFGDDPSLIYDLETWPGEGYLHVNLIPMQRIEAGEFTLGSQGSDTARTASLDAFSVDQYEVTNRLYKECVDKGPCEAPQNTEQYANLDNANHPVTWITLEQAKTYCAYVGKQLPTEDQWEAAARGNDERMYPWGDNDPDEKRANFDQVYTSTLEVIWDPSISAHENHVSPYGVHHMAGNVREWVLSQSGQVITRGGGWKDTAEDIKTTMRFVEGNIAAEDVGFRCAVKADEFPFPLP